MARVWKEALSPKQVNDYMNCYHGMWMPQMDRCWYSDDGLQVTSRLLITDWGKIEHAAITLLNKENFLSSDGSRDIPWAVKQEIKNELFGENRIAIEVFPEESHKVDVLDVYHLWIFPKNFVMPFGIHPTKDKQCRVVNRGVPKDPTRLAANTAEILEMRDGGKFDV